MDLPLRRLCGLPVFFGLEVLLGKLQFVCVEKFLAIDAKCSDEFTAELVGVAPFLLEGLDPAETESLLDTILKKREQLAQLWQVIVAGAQGFLWENARAHGFGQADWGRTGSSSSINTLKRGLSSSSLRELNTRSPKKPIVKPIPEDPTVVSLKGKEASAKLKWIVRLESIAEAAGKFSRLNQEAEDLVGALTPLEKHRMRRLVLGVGSFRTMNAHIRHWERLADWSVGARLEVYPLDIDVLLKYLMTLDDRGCGPTVITSVRSAVSWIGSRLQMDVPNTFDARIKALEQKVIEERAKEIREAVPFPVLLVKAMEVYVHFKLQDDSVYSLYVGWVLCMIFASLRFNDACHVSPDSLELKDEGLYGLAWQTKVDRRRRGTKFVVTNASFSGLPWLEEWWKVFNNICPGSRDFWMLEVGSEKHFLPEPTTHARGLQTSPRQNL